MLESGVRQGLGARIRGKAWYGLGARIRANARARC